MNREGAERKTVVALEQPAHIGSVDGELRSHTVKHGAHYGCIVKRALTPIMGEALVGSEAWNFFAVKLFGAACAGVTCRASS